MNNDTSQKTIVIADDDSFITHAYKAGLEEAGYLVIVATDGEEALKQIQALHPDVVLMELILPQLDGFSLLKTLSEDPLLADIPVIVLTNLSQDSDVEEARRLGADDVMVKSDVSLQDVLAQIDRLLAAA